MSAVFDAVANVAPATGGSFTINITVPSSLPVLLVGIALSSATATISSVSWSLGSGTPVELKTDRVNSTFGSVWVIPAPVAGAGVLTVNLSASVPFQGAAETFTGADQTTPCPTADAVSTNNVNQAQLIVTPLNLTANDASFGIGGQTVTGDPSGISVNDRFKNNTTAINIQAGGSAGTAALSANWTGGGDQVAIGVRIVPAAGGGGGGFVPDEDYLIFVPSRR